MYYFFEENMIKNIFLYIYYLLIIKIIYIMNIFFMDGIISFKLFFVIFFCLNVIVECKGFGYGINYFKFSNEDNESFIYNVSFIYFDKFKTLPFYYEKQVLNATSFFLQKNKTINSALFINNINDLKQLSNSKIPLIGIILLKFIENTEKSNKYLNNSLVKYFIINDTKKEVQDFILTNIYNKKVQINFNRSDKNYLVFIIIPLISIILQIFIIVLFSKMKKIYRNNGILKIHKFIGFCPIFIFLLILTLISQIISTIKNNDKYYNNLNLLYGFFLSIYKGYFISILLFSINGWQIIYFDDVYTKFNFSFCSISFIDFLSEFIIYKIIDFYPHIHLYYLKNSFEYIIFGITSYFLYKKNYSITTSLIKFYETNKKNNLLEGYYFKIEKWTTIIINVLSYFIFRALLPITQNFLFEIDKQHIMHYIIEVFIESLYCVEFHIFHFPNNLPKRYCVNIKQDLFALFPYRSKFNFNNLIITKEKIDKTIKNNSFIIVFNPFSKKENSVMSIGHVRVF